MLEIKYWSANLLTFFKELSQRIRDTLSWPKLLSPFFQCHNMMNDIHFSQPPGAGQLGLLTYDNVLFDLNLCNWVPWWGNLPTRWLTWWWCACWRTTSATWNKRIHSRSRNCVLVVSGFWLAVYTEGPFRLSHFFLRELCDRSAALLVLTNWRTHFVYGFLLYISSCIFPAKAWWATAQLATNIFLIGGLWGMKWGDSGLKIT